MTHALGCYYAPEHARQSDRDFISKLQPPVIRLLDPDVQQIADMHALAPNAIIAPRTWVIDDNSGAAVRNLMADPIKTGQDHAWQYGGQLDRWQDEARQRGLTLPPTERIYFNAANEPNQGGAPDKIAAYNVAFLDACTGLGIRASALCLGVGWPDNTGPDTPVNWKPYADAGLVEAIKRGNHWLELHEYNYKTGPQDGWRWLAGRHLQCPFDVPILLGEIGVDNYVDKPRWDKEGGNRGWQGNISADQYAEMIEYHITRSDTRVVAALIFITDFRNREWQSFDTDPAHGALLARKDNMTPKAKPTTPTQPTPTPPATSTPAYILAKAGANLRTAPISGAIITAVPYSEQIRIIGVMDTSGWLHVRWRDTEGYMASQLVGLVAPEPLQPEPDKPVEPPDKPQPMPTGILDPRVLQAILNIESGGRTHGENGKPIIRFEAHVFEDRAGHTGHFRYNELRPWTDQQWRSGDIAPWRNVHTGQQADEYAAFEFAKSINPEAAHQAISVGAGQILGINHARIGYPSAIAMYKAFQSAPVQTIGFINFFLSDAKLMEAIRNKDWREIARRYNGSGAVDTYAPLLEKAYKELG